MDDLTYVAHENDWFPAVYIHEFYEPKFPLASRIVFIRSKLPNCSAHVSGVTAAS